MDNASSASFIAGRWAMVGSGCNEARTIAVARGIITATDIDTNIIYSSVVKRVSGKTVAVESAGKTEYFVRNGGSLTHVIPNEEDQEFTACSA